MSTPQQNKIAERPSPLTGLGKILATSSALKSYVSITDRLILGGTNFLTFAIIGRACGLEDLGMFALAWTIVLTVSVLQEAFVYSPFTVFMAQKRSDGLLRPYSGCALAMHAILTIATLAVLGIATILGWAFGATEAQVNMALATLAAIPLYALREFARRYLFASLRAIPVLLVDVLSCAGQLSALGVLWGTGLLSPMSAMLAIAATTGLPALFWLIGNKSSFGLPQRGILRDTLRRHWTFGRWVSLSQLSDITVTHGITWLVAALAGTAAAGLFAACNSIVMVINPLLLGVGSILLPRTSRAKDEYGPSEVSRIVWKTTGLLVVAVGAICVLIALLAEPLITLIYDVDPASGAVMVILLLAAANFCAAAAFAVDNGLMVANRPDMNFIASMIGLIGTLAIAAVLTPVYGVAGTALGSLIGTFLNSLFQMAAFGYLVGKPVLR